jgi:hypothetical protein
MRFRIRMVSILLLSAPATASAAVLSVGPGQLYAKPCDAIAAASPGDIIQVDASGSYDGDHCSWATDNLTVQGVNGRAKIDAGHLQANVAGDKGIFVITALNATVENFELSGAVADPSSNNGAGIRHQGTNLTVRNCYFHDNQDGILAAPPSAGTGTVDIESSEFANNGAGDGYSHNMYIGDYGTFILNASYSHGAKVGHLVKSRAYMNLITYNRLTDESGTTASYEVDIPQGGTTFIIGNLIEQSAASQNPTIVTYAEESSANPDQHLFVVNNTLVNDKSSGTFVHVAAAQPPAVVMNNIFDGPGTVVSQAGAALTTNFDSAQMGNPMLVDPATFDYHLAAGSPCIDQGTSPPTAMGQSLDPVAEYVQPLSTDARVVAGAAIDIGAYELGDEAALADGGLPDGGFAVADAGAGSGPDAGSAPDASVGPDSGVAPVEDAGLLDEEDGSIVNLPATHPPNVHSGGCACGSAGFSADGLVLLLLLPVLRRRRPCLAALSRRRMETASSDQ